MSTELADKKIIEAETTEEKPELGLYTQHGMIHTSEMENHTLQHLASQGGGELISKTSAAVSKVVSALAYEGHDKGKITITLSYTSSGDGAIKCISRVKTDLPVEANESLYFATPEGGLSRNRQ